MSIINFSVPNTLDRKIKAVIKTRGFSSKAELFRYAVMRYFEETENLPFSNNPRIAALSRSLEAELLSKLGTKPLPSIGRQLARIKSF